MKKQLLMGNEAIALGAMRAGVHLVTGYPGTPSTEVLETVAKHNDGSIYVEWSVNEKAAMEVAAGAAYTGARAMVTMKQVGLNVAADPLMSLNYVGVKGGLVVVVADDPGPLSSQTEQDSRHFGIFAKLPVFDPSTVEEAYTMIGDAFAYSEKYGTPVLFRPTTRVCHSCAAVEIQPNLPRTTPEGFVKDARWVIFPKLSYAGHLHIEENLKKMGEELSRYTGNLLLGEGTKGVLTGGVSYAYVREGLDALGAACKLLKISALPFPEKLVLEFLQGLQQVLVVEELDPVLENQLAQLCGRQGIPLQILGKNTGHIGIAGENSVDGVRKALAGFLGVETTPAPVVETPPLPMRPPVLCAGCPHRASFFAVKQAMKGQKAVFSGDIGCYTLGNAMPLDMVDTCLCMGAGITVAQGLQRIEPEVKHFAFVGDSTFFHTGIPGIVNAVYNGTDIVVVVLDNSTTAMTGSQPHPGTGQTMMGTKAAQISIYEVVKALGVSKIVRANPFNQPQAKQAVADVVNEKGVRVILYEAPCIVLEKSKTPLCVNPQTCTGCGLCVTSLGCPALYMQEGKAVINTVQCTGCGLCQTQCNFGAIGGRQ